MKIITKSIEIAHNLFPETYSKREFSGQAFHYAFAYRRNTLLSIGQNSYQISNKALYFGRRFGIQQQIDYPSKHAEVDCISKLWGKYHLDSSIKLVVIRLNRFGKLCNSKPCSGCQELINALSINKVWYSDENGHITI